MRHDTSDSDDTPDEYETAYAESALGYGGIVLGSDGVLRPMPEHEAIASHLSVATLR
jgi:hypothetical protein